MAAEVKYEDIIADYRTMVSDLTYENLCYKRVVAQLEREVDHLRGGEVPYQKTVEDAIDESL